MPVAPALHRRLLAPLLILTAGSLVVIALAVNKPTAKPQATAQPALPEAHVIAITPQTLRLPVFTQGTVAPRREIDLVTQVGGRITEVGPDFVNGGFFAAGQTLATVEPRDYELTLIQAEARVAQARQELATIRGQARQARREWRDLGNAEANDLFLKKPQVAAAEAALAAAEAERDQARLNLQRTAIAPLFAGRIRETYVDLGQFVSPGSKIARIYDASTAEVRLPLTDAQAALLDLPLNRAPDTPASPLPVTLRGVIAGQPHVWQAVIRRTEASLDTRSRQYYAVAEIDQPFASHHGQTPIIIGLFVEAEIRGRALPDVIQLPRTAVFGGDQVFVVDADNIIHQQTAEVISRNDHNIVIRGSFGPDQRLVIDRQNLLTDGIRIVPLSLPQTAPQ